MVKIFFTLGQGCLGSEDAGLRWGENLKEARGYVFPDIVVNIWYELAEEVIDADTITMFKICLDRCLVRKGVKGYGPNIAK